MTEPERNSIEKKQSKSNRKPFELLEILTAIISLLATILSGIVGVWTQTLPIFLKISDKFLLPLLIAIAIVFILGGAFFSVRKIVQEQEKERKLIYKDTLEVNKKIFDDLHHSIDSMVSVVSPAGVKKNG